MIYPATSSHWDEIQEIYAIARGFMAENGNPTQWENGYPSHHITQTDIERGQLFVYEEEGRIQGVFAMIHGDDPDYAVIDGSWCNDEPYVAIHRLASRREVRGVVSHCLRWALTQSDNIRIDTHKDNVPMQRALERLGFTQCGTIHILHDGTPRIAYQISITP